jgi:hypothetical protein
MSGYSWLTKTKAVSSLQGRLSNSQYWTSTELWLYITEALRVWNSLTEQWNDDLVIASNDTSWRNTGTESDSPRLRSVTDTNLYTQMEYMLLEPATGGATWTGSTQFDLASLQYALQKRTQEVIQATACNLVKLSGSNSFSTVPGTRVNTLPDTVLEPRRINFAGIVTQHNGTATSGSQSITVDSITSLAIGQLLVGTGIQDNTFITGISGLVLTVSLPTTAALASAVVKFYMAITLTREDTQAFQYFEPDYLQTSGIPQSWGVSSEPPLSFTVDLAPDTPGYYDIIALKSGPTFAPPTASLLGVPDDWSWLPMYGALADVLSKEAEATDKQRAAYCLQRYTDGLEIMKNSNWLVKASINSVPVDTPCLQEMDDYLPGWEFSANNIPAIVQGGIDFLAATTSTGESITLTLVQNAPLLDSTSTYVQVSRDDWQAVLDYAQHVAMFKQAGAEFVATGDLLKSFFSAAESVNKRLLTYGIYTDVLKTQGQRQDTHVIR